LTLGKNQTSIIQSPKTEKQNRHENDTNFCENYEECTHRLETRNDNVNMQKIYKEDSKYEWRSLVSVLLASRPSALRFYYNDSHSNNFQIIINYCSYTNRRFKLSEDEPSFK